jgi:hypothetical protein
MVLTSSYGAMSSLMPEVSTSTRPSSWCSTATPMRFRSFTVVAMSLRRGTLRTTAGPSASSVAARIGSAEFFAPEILSSPARGLRPTMASLSMPSPWRPETARNLEASHYERACHSSGVNVCKASAWISRPTREPSVA